MEHSNQESITKLLEQLNILSNSHQETQRQDAIHRIHEFLSSQGSVRTLSSKEIRPFLSQGLDRLDGDVADITLQALSKFAESEEYVSILDDDNYIQLLMNTLQGQNIGIADRMSKILLKMASTKKGLDILFRDDVVAGFRRIARSSDIAKFRVLDLFASISSVSNDAFSYCDKNQFLQDVLSAVQTEDVLQQMNALELLDKVVRSPLGAKFLDESHTIDKLLNILKSDDDLMNAFLAPKIISFLGELGSQGDVQIDLFEKKNAPSILKHILDEGSNEAKAAVITAIGKIGSSPRGLKLLSSSALLSEYMYCINLEGDVRVIFLHSFGYLLKAFPKNDSSYQSSISDLQRLVDNVPVRSGRTEPITSIIMPLLRQPFEEQRYAVQDTISGLACHSFGAKQLLNFPGFIEYITNRKNEETKTGKEWQYFIIQNLVKTVESDLSLLDKPKLNELIKYLRAGVFYIAAESRVEVATKQGGGGV